MHYLSQVTNFLISPRFYEILLNSLNGITRDLAVKML